MHFDTSDLFQNNIGIHIYTYTNEMLLETIFNKYKRILLIKKNYIHVFKIIYRNSLILLLKYLSIIIYEYKKKLFIKILNFVFFEIYL